MWRSVCRRPYITHAERLYRSRSGARDASHLKRFAGRPNRERTGTDLRGQQRDEQAGCSPAGLVFSGPLQRTPEAAIDFRRLVAKSAESDTLSCHRVRVSICSVLDRWSGLSGL